MYRIGFILLLMYNEASSQHVSFKWSEKVSSKGIINNCGTSASHFFTSQMQDTRTVLFRRYDSSLQLKKADTLVLPNKNQQYITSFTAEARLVHIIAQKEKKNQINILLIKNSFDESLQNTASVVAELKDGYKGNVFAYYSEDRSRLLITNFNFEAATATIKREFIVINTASGTVQFSGTVSIQGANEQIGVANNGMVWLSAIQIYSWKNRLVEKPKTLQKIIFIAPGNRYSEFNIQFDTKYTPGVDFVQGEGSELYVTGFAYDNDSKASRLSDCELFIYKVDSEKGMVADSAFTSFTGLYPGMRLKEDDRLPYTVKHIYKRTDGAYTLLAEQYQLITGQYSATQKYHDIACIQLNKDFKFESVTRIPKLQSAADNPSFISTLWRDSIYLVYSDHKENLHAEADNLNYPSGKQTRNALFLVTIDKKGQVRKEVIYDYSSGMPVPQILSGFMLNSHTMIFPAEGQIGTLRIGNILQQDK